ncbi:MAG: hypothetical protein QN155_07415 [Armatimonadota bacterium]|nr:hypothetical protein [Armatimonadota bacterium]MDR7404850.1 hypothetical protein [Armatimonadota bacterium]MDR7472482.1 hypothetical protein [Armatimonadota bacterium]MDR7517094.1 hypothetical protein [Armatimonadota bacterium]MDR7561542.1 hypothetical protein [Armatimonadota bacterium]
MAESEERQDLGRAAEDVIRRLRGVQAVRVETDEAGAIQTVHVLGGPDRSARVIAADVVSALAAELGVQLEPRQVRVAAQQRAEAAPPAQARLKFVGLTVSNLRQTAEVKVHLEDQGLLYEGIATGPSARAARLELVAQAALRALELYLRTDGLFLLEGVALAPVGGRQVAVVTLSLAGRDDETLVGSSVVRDDPREAVVRAVLDATNRPVSWLLGR